VLSELAAYKACWGYTSTDTIIITTTTATGIEWSDEISAHGSIPKNLYDQCGARCPDLCKVV
jgi:hypothetical protein